MPYEVTMTPENHGYTIRLEKRTFTKGGAKEVSETITTLAIIWEYKSAHEAFDILNTFISVCAEKGIFDGNLFRYRKPQ